MLDELLYRAFDLVEKLGAPLVIAAWLTVFLGAIAMAVVLRRRAISRAQWIGALTVGGLGLIAHLLDYTITLRISPDLAMEANPIWRLAVRGLGLPIAKLYGLTGKILVSILSAQLFAFYLTQRRELFPPGGASGFFDFHRKFGAHLPRRFGISWPSLASFFAFLFACLGPYFFYVVAMNSIGEFNHKLYDRLPSPIAAIAAYLVLVSAAYFVLNWRAFRRAV